MACCVTFLVTCTMLLLVYDMFCALICQQPSFAKGSLDVRHALCS